MLNQLHQTEVVFPIHLFLTFTSWKIVPKAFTSIYTLNVCVLTFQTIFFFSKGAGGEEELSTDPFSCSEQVKTKPCWSSLRGYYSRPRKYFGLYLFKKKKSLRVSASQRLINHHTFNKAGTLTLWQPHPLCSHNSDLTALII